MRPGRKNAQVKKETRRIRDLQSKESTIRGISSRGNYENDKFRNPFRGGPRGGRAKICISIRFFGYSRHCNTIVRGGDDLYSRLALKYIRVTMDGEILEIVIKNSRVMKPRDLAVLECVDSVTKSNIARYKLWNQMHYPERRLKMKDVKQLARSKARGVQFYDDITVDCGEVWHTARYVSPHEYGTSDDYDDSPIISFSVNQKTLETIKETFPGACIEFHGWYCTISLCANRVEEEVLRTIDNLMMRHNISNVELFEYPDSFQVNSPSYDCYELGDEFDEFGNIILPVVAGPANRYDNNGVGPGGYSVGPIVEDPIRVYQWIPGSAPSPGDFSPVIAGPVRR